MSDPRLQQELQALATREQMPEGFMSTVERFYAPLATSIAQRHKALQRMTVIGICGPQGSGKSTMTAFLELLLRQSGLKTAILSIDDLYLMRAEREKLARDVHPLLKTRGPPGTHDVAMGLSVLNQLNTANADQTTLIPRFDKSSDDRAPLAQWSAFAGRPDIVIFEGWCVGAKPQPEAALVQPINTLERGRDAHGIWRRYVNDSLAGPYQRLFERIDLLILLMPPSFDKVFEWRALQEEKLRKNAPKGTHLMTPEEIAIFIMHYERITRHILDEMPARADYVLDIAADHKLSALRSR
jgi:D-glycerate 3-kinase